MLNDNLGLGMSPKTNEKRSEVFTQPSLPPKLTKKSPERHVTSCHLVDVSLHAFLAPTASVCELPSAVNTNSVEDEAECGEVRLVKSSELGLGLALQGSASPATAQVK